MQKIGTTSPSGLGTVIAWFRSLEVGRNFQNARIRSSRAMWASISAGVRRPLVSLKTMSMSTFHLRDREVAPLHPLIARVEERPRDLDLNVAVCGLGPIKMDVALRIHVERQRRLEGRAEDRAIAPREPSPERDQGRRARHDHAARD